MKKTFDGKKDRDTILMLYHMGAVLEVQHTSGWGPSNIYDPPDRDPPDKAAWRIKEGAWPDCTAKYRVRNEEKNI